TIHYYFHLFFLCLFFFLIPFDAEPFGSSLVSIPEPSIPPSPPIPPPPPSIFPRPPAKPPAIFRAMPPYKPPRFICAIIFRICSYCRRSWLTSPIVEPEPRATRVFRLASSSL